jgi:tRNA (cmo5U34)-methyltransferase
VVVSEPAGAPETGWRTAGLTAEYLEVRKALIPMLEVMEDLVRRLLARAPRPIARFLDVGCGAGAMSVLVGSVAGSAEAVLVDFSEPMLAEARLRGDERWEVVRADLGDPAWREALPAGSFDAVVSGLAIHHLPGPRKRELFGEIYDLLEPGGLFVNMDHVVQHGPLAGLWDEEMLAAAVRLERGRGGERSAQEIESGMLDDSAEDRPDPAEDQVAWLRGVGFAPADVYFKWAEGAVFGGLRPARPQEER